MRNYQCRGKSYQPSRSISQKPNPTIVLLCIVSGENKHGNERIDLFGK